MSEDGSVFQSGKAQPRRVFSIVGKVGVDRLMVGKFRMLSDPTGLMILRTLMTDGERIVTQIVEQIGSTQAKIFRHLKQLS